MAQFQYLTDPREIERRSFAQIRQLTDLDRFDADQQQIAMRLIHTSGDPRVVEDLYFSPGAVTAGLACARARGATHFDLLDYRTSAAASGDRSRVVGYAAISMERDG